METPVKSLSSDELYTRCDPDLFDFETTEELDPLQQIIGQERATESLQFGMGMDRDGYNVFALGPGSTDKENLVHRFLEDRAAAEGVPNDWCYVYNFDHPHKPCALELPPGIASQFREDMDQFTDELQTALTAAFESEEYQTRRQVLEEQFQDEQQESLEELQEKAEEKGLTLLRTPAGFAFAPIRDGEVIPPNEIQKLPEEEREQLEEDVEELQSELQQMLRKVPAKQRDLREQIRELNQEIARLAARDLIQEIREKYADLEVIQDHLDAIKEDIVQNITDLVQRPGPDGNGYSAQLAQMQQAQQEEQMLQRYRVNDLIDHAESEHAPVVYEDNPTLQNLIGRIEYRAQMGALLTDFTLIKQGALHRANGGYLILDIRKVLTEPMAWEALKRTLRSGEIRIRSLREAMGFVSTISLEPEPVPLDVKVVLLGERWFYYMLHALDPEFSDLFKVEADFNDQMDRSDKNQQLYARLLGSMIREMELFPLDRSGVLRIIEHSARMVDDGERLSTATRDIKDLLSESDYWARQNGGETISRTDIDNALEARRRRAGRIRERMQENILRDTIFIDTEGEVTGQINGLSVLQIGQDTFGKPNRITARVHLGKGDVVDIEREVELGGPIHSKGVLILSSFLGARYAEERPLSLSASLVFEQSYGGIEGDSASSAELYALLSAISEVPLKQSLAVTGSVNQHGQVQPIGGVNEKIEGFFEICRERGLTGNQGVLIPAANTKNLMLREEVAEAVENELFSIYPIQHIDQGMELLTGISMGKPLDDGSFPENSINHRVATALEERAHRRVEFSQLSDNEQ
jgi:predicted ATP-dependent protease